MLQSIVHDTGATTNNCEQQIERQKQQQQPCGPARAAGDHYRQQHS